MTILRSLLVVAGLLLSSVLHAQQLQQGEFVPIDQLPAQDQLPAAPLLIAAYIFALMALVGYLLSISRRLRGVQQEVTRLEKEIAGSGSR